MLSSTLPVRFALEFFAEEGLNAGDVLVANDPYHGGGHLPDYNVFAPVVVDGELVLIASIQCHHADTGGGMPGGYNAEAIDVWAEGVRIPAVKVHERGVPRRDVLYMLNDSGGVLTTFRPASGEVLHKGWLEEAQDNYYASPVAADGKVFFVSESGIVSVVEPSGRFERLAVSELDEPCYATPAIDGGRIYLRTTARLYCFGLQEEKER